MPPSVLVRYTVKYRQAKLLTICVLRDIIDKQTWPFSSVAVGVGSFDHPEKERETQPATEEENMSPEALHQISLLLDRILPFDADPPEGLFSPLQEAGIYLAEVKDRLRTQVWLAQ